MNESYPGNTAQMVLRAWIEPGSEKPLRVRVHLPSQQEQNARYYSDRSEVGKMVEAWLAGLQDASRAN
jgi:hypothetical protein